MTIERPEFRRKSDPVKEAVKEAIKEWMSEKWNETIRTAGRYSLRLAGILVFGLLIKMLLFFHVVDLRAFFEASNDFVHEKSVERTVTQ